MEPPYPRGWSLVARAVGEEEALLYTHRGCAREAAKRGLITTHAVEALPYGAGVEVIDEQ
jgi:hypothetical protein